MSDSAAIWNVRWGSWIVEELVRCGVDTFYISPGSRSTPLTAAAARHLKTRCKVIYDERGAAYHALGYARATGKPAALICTSGTAAANYFPAVTEASVEHIPLLALTADRPPELRQTGANQSIDQDRLYGKHVRWFFDPGCPGPEFPPESLLSTIDHAVLRTRHPLPGPVQLNFPFREPFLPSPETPPVSLASEDVLPLQWRQSMDPWVKHEIPRRETPAETIRKLIDLLPERGILSIGRVPPAALDPVRKLAESLGWPVFANVASGLRLGADCPNRVTYFDQLLQWEITNTTRHESSRLHPDTDRQPLTWQPETVWHLGFPPTSKRWLSYWEQHPAPQMVWISDHSERQDPVHRFRTRIEADISEFCCAVTEELAAQENPKKKDSWRRQWLDASDRVDRLMTEHFQTAAEKGEIDEFSLVRRLTEILPADHGFFIGNSLPVREVDIYGSINGHAVPTALNRGASGIDGIIASAAGYAAGLRKPVTLLIGDLSALHDLSSLDLLKQSEFPVTVVLLNNRGGGIFSFLPIAEHQDIFEPFFATPHSLDFRHAASMFGLDYCRPDSMDSFERAYRHATRKSVPAIIQVFTDREQNLRQQQTWHQVMHEKLPEITA